jgi:hypothetical protein
MFYSTNKKGVIQQPHQSKKTKTASNLMKSSMPTATKWPNSNERKRKEISILS